MIGNAKATGSRPSRILWIAPNLNHYKKRFLARLMAFDVEGLLNG